MTSTPTTHSEVPVIDQSWSECFACGPHETHGLRMAYRFLDESTLEAPVRFDRRFQGFQGVIHGGLLTTALDDAMANLVCFRGETAVTGELTIRFRRPVLVDEPVVARAWIVKRSGKLLECASAIVDLDGVRRVEATGKFLITGPLVPPAPQG